MPPADYRQLVASAFDLRWQLDPVAATYAGVGTHDGRLGRFARPDVRAALAALKAMTGALEQLTVDDLADEIDQTALLNDLRCTIKRFEKEKPHELNPEFHLSHLLSGLFALLVRRGQPVEHRARALAGRLAEVPRFLDDAQATLQRPASVFSETALDVARGGQQLLAEAVPAFAAPLPTELRQGIEEVLPAARDALRDFRDFLAGELTDRSDGDFAVGREAFDFRLHYEHALRETAPEILRYGETLVAEIEADLVRRAEVLASGTPWRELAERLRKTHPRADAVVQAYAAEMVRARGFVEQDRLVTIPPGQLEVVATPAWLRPLVPFAAYDPPGAFAEDRTGFFYVTVPDGDGLRDHCTWEIGGTALHEGYPGHHLQFLAAQAQPSPVRRVITSPLTVEGWALYCEDLMAERGFLQSPEAAFFQRLHLLWRAVRIILDVNLHTGGLTVDRAISQMVETLGISRSNAEAEVRRYCATPGYQLCYAVGRRELLRLREDYRRRAGASFTLQRFHDVVLSYGGLPVSLMRWGMGLGD